MQPDDHPVAVAHLVRLVGLCPSSVITVESHIVADICIALKCFTRLATVQQLWEQPAYLYHAAQIIQDELARVEKVLKAEHGKL
uniref:Uncharacterized protein n=1 Tax=viral metagenome TaxID=1070528 RepID=A0A6M3L843_9ZZZZ